MIIQPQSISVLLLPLRKSASMTGQRFVIVLLAGLLVAQSLHAQAALPAKADLTPDFERYGLITQ